MQYIFEINSDLLSTDCQLQPPVCQESGRSPAPPPLLSLALAVCLIAEVAPWPFPHGYKFKDNFRLLGVMIEREI